MPQPFDSVARQRVMLVRRSLTQAAADAGAPHDDMARVSAVVLFDFAVESMLKAALEAVRSSAGQPGRGFIGVLDALDHGLTTAVGRGMTSRHQALALHRIRNAAQHEARIPSDAEVAQAQARAEVVTGELAELVWGVDLASLSLAAGVRDVYARTCLTEAEAQFAAGRYVRCVELAAAAFESMLGLASLAFGSPPQQYTDGLVTVEGIASDGREVLQLLANVAEAVVLQRTGVSQAATRRLRSLTGTAWQVSGISGTKAFNIWPHIDRATARDALAFCTTSALRIEAEVGDVYEPYGISYGYVIPDEDELRANVPEALVRRAGEPDLSRLPEGLSSAEWTGRLRRIERRLLMVAATLDPVDPQHAWLLEHARALINVIRSDRSPTETTASGLYDDGELLLRYIARVSGCEIPAPDKLHLWE
jgi:hypothetical protein